MYYLVSKIWWILVAILFILLLSGCAGFPQEVGAIDLPSVESIDTLKNEVTNHSTNVPISYLYIVALGFWCVRTPWGLVSDFIGMSKVRRGLL